MRVLVLQSGVVGRQISLFLMDNFPQDEYFVYSTPGNSLSQQDKKVGNFEEIVLPGEQISSAEHGEFDIGVLAWWPGIVKKPLLSETRLGFINVHPSFLPFGRGKDPNFWSLACDDPFGVSIHLVDEKIDHGPVLARREIPKTWEDNGETLYRKALDECVALFQEQWPLLREAVIDGTIRDLGQEFELGILRTRGQIDEASRLVLSDVRSVREVLNIMRARTFPPHPAAWFEEKGEIFEVRIEIKKVVKGET